VLKAEAAAADLLLPHQLIILLLRVAVVVDALFMRVKKLVAGVELVDLDADL
jgi:hypothetical protein